ncbi:MAG: TlpA family protein disulfide reductase, partial [Ileibacterium sp.]|nr:TlpA family protein disulfide reductase [Ileibacterium sp.]
MKNIKKLFVVFCLLMMSIGMAACSSQAKENAGSGEEQKSFSKFQGVDFDGNKVDESIFRKNKVTLVNLWHNECNACIEEMPMLEELNKELKAKGAEVIGLNVNAQGQENDPVVTEAKEILKKQGAAYRNIAVNAGDEVFKLIENTVLFPTNVLVDQNG